MKTAVVIGSTGLIGGILIEKLAHERTWSQILAITRKPTAFSNPKIRGITFDFQRWEELDLQIKSFAGINGLDFFCCLGTTISKAGSEEAFKKVDHNAVVEFAEVASRCSAESLIIVSALGADPTSSVFYNRTKGEMERDVEKVALKSLHFLRPSLLLGDRAEFRFFERLAILLAPVYSVLLIGPLKKYRPVQANAVAGAMVALANKKVTTSTVIENEFIARLSPANLP